MIISLCACLCLISTKLLLQNYWETTLKSRRNILLCWFTLITVRTDAQWVNTQMNSDMYVCNVCWVIIRIIISDKYHRMRWCKDGCGDHKIDVSKGEEEYQFQGCRRDLAGMHRGVKKPFQKCCNACPSMPISSSLSPNYTHHINTTITRHSSPSSNRILHDEFSREFHCKNLFFFLRLWQQFRNKF
jgi:hypothetical protein